MSLNNIKYKLLTIIYKALHDLTFATSSTFVSTPLLLAHSVQHCWPPCCYSNMPRMLLIRAFLFVFPSASNIFPPDTFPLDVFRPLLNHHPSPNTISKTACCLSLSLPLLHCTHYYLTLYNMYCLFLYCPPTHILTHICKHTHTVHTLPLSLHHLKKCLAHSRSYM